MFKKTEITIVKYKAKFGKNLYHPQHCLLSHKLCLTLF